MTFEIVTEIHADLENITDADLTRCMRNVGKVRRGQPILGKVESNDLQRLFALIMRYKALEDKANHFALFEAITAEEETEHLRVASRNCSLHKLANSIFWNEIKHQLDRDGNAWNAATLGLRHGWRIVASGTSRGPHAGGGMTAIPLGGLGAALASLFGGISGGGIGGAYADEGDQTDDDE